MDFTKFVSMLETSSLFLSRATEFEDPYEGSWPRANRDPQALLKIGVPETLDLSGMSEMSRSMRYWTYVNCWHMNERESAAMWKLYAKTDEAVAIQSTYTILHNCLPDKSYIGVVNYIDYENQMIPFDNVFWPYTHKRLSFEHERELRVIEVDFPSSAAVAAAKAANLQTSDWERETPKGKLINIEIKQLIEAVYVSPTAPPWFFDLVEAVVNRYKCGFNAKQSDMARTPIF